MLNKQPIANVTFRIAKTSTETFPAFYRHTNTPMNLWHTTPVRIASIFLCCIALALGGQTLHAQENSDTQGVFTMKVYANLIQVPTVILDADRKPIPHLTREKIAISIDQGPTFPPTRMHVEGDEPISLSILLDASGNQRLLLNSFGKAFAKLAPKYLHPADHLSVYALDCTLLRTLVDAPADAATAAAAFSAALAAPTLHGPPVKGRTDKPACANTLPLWDTLMKMSLDLHQSRNRRVILVVSQGHDGKSVTAFENAAYAVGTQGIAVFAVRERLEYETNRTMASAISGFHSMHDISEDYLSRLTGKNGGRVFNITTDQLSNTLQDFIAMLRARYIIEFPRPDDITSGQHGIEITLPGVDADVRAAGASVPPSDPSLRADPLTIPSSASPAVIGTKRPKPTKD